MAKESVPPRLAPIRDIMTTEVAVATPADRLLDAATVMRERHVSGLPVVDAERRVVGVVSEQDIVQEVHRTIGVLSFRGILDLLLAFSGREDAQRIRQAVERMESVRVRDVMSAKPVTLEPDDTVQEAHRLVVQYGINRIPVVDADQLVGIVTRADILAGLAPKPPGRLATGDEPALERARNRAVRSAAL